MSRTVLAVTAGLVVRHLEHGHPNPGESFDIQLNNYCAQQVKGVDWLSFEVFLAGASA